MHETPWRATLASLRAPPLPHPTDQRAPTMPNSNRICRCLPVSFTLRPVSVTLRKHGDHPAARPGNYSPGFARVGKLPLISQLLINL